MNKACTENNHIQCVIYLWLLRVRVIDCHFSETRFYNALWHFFLSQPRLYSFIKHFLCSMPMNVIHTRKGKLVYGPSFIQSTQTKGVIKINLKRCPVSVWLDLKLIILTPRDFQVNECHQLRLIDARRMFWDSNWNITNWWCDSTDMHEATLIGCYSN